MDADKNMIERAGSFDLASNMLNGNYNSTDQFQKIYAQEFDKLEILRDSLSYQHKNKEDLKVQSINHISQLAKIQKDLKETGNRVLEV